MKAAKVFLTLAVLACMIFTGCRKDPYEAAGLLDNKTIEMAQKMTAHIEGTDIEVRSTKVNQLVFGGSYADINVEENWVQTYFTIIPESMFIESDNTTVEINGSILAKMKSKDIIDAEFDITDNETQGTCADVQEEIYAAVLDLLTAEEKAKYLSEGKQLSFIQDDHPGDNPGDNPVTIGTGWLDVDPAIMITLVDDNYFYEPLGLYVTMDNPIFQGGGGDERYRGVRYCKLLSHQVILSWLLIKSFEDNPVLITESDIVCTDPSSRITTLGSCLFKFPLAGYYYCSDYTGSDFTAATAEEKCQNRPTIPGLPPTYSLDPCSERTAEIEAVIPGYQGFQALCAVHCNEGNEFIWNVYEENPEAACGDYDIFYPED